MGTAVSRAAPDLDEAEREAMSQLNGTESRPSLKLGTAASRGATEMSQAGEISDALPCRGSALHDTGVPPEPKSPSSHQHASSEHVAIDVAEL